MSLKLSSIFGNEDPGLRELTRRPTNSLTLQLFNSDAILVLSVPRNQPNVSYRKLSSFKKFPSFPSYQLPSIRSFLSFFPSFFPRLFYAFLLRRDLVSKFSASSCNNALKQVLWRCRVCVQSRHPFIANNRDRVQPTFRNFSIVSNRVKRD